jgi:glycosyltransferase involved in cell wall biosynthesis
LTATRLTDDIAECYRSWEKNLLLLVKALTLLPAHLPPGTQMPKMVFVGHGPAKNEIERLCCEKNIEAVFMGYQEKAELARCYASADFFCFPSFTEVSRTSCPRYAVDYTHMVVFQTFGQVVLEALAFGLVSSLLRLRS